MKNLCKKISDVLKTIFGYGIMISLFAGGLTFFGYVVALCIGGDSLAETFFLFSAFTHGKLRQNIHGSLDHGISPF